MIDPTKEGYMGKVKEKIDYHQNLAHLSDFANFLITHHLAEFLLVSRTLMRDLDVPLLKRMSKEEADELSDKSTRELLTHIAEKNQAGHIKNAISRWTSNQFPRTERNQIVVEDITLIAHARKLALLQFLPFYTSESSRIIEIVADIERYILQYTSAAFHAFVSIVDGRIQEYIGSLENSQELFKQAQALTQIGNYVWDTQAKTLTWSDQLYRIYELDPDESPITNALAGSFNHPEDADIVQQEMKTSRETLKPFDFHYRIITRNGHLKHLHARGEFEVINGTDEVRIFGTCQDVSVQKQTEKELRQNQTFIKKIADAIPAVIASYNINSGQYTFLSGGLKKLLDYDPEEGMKGGAAFFTSIIHPDDLGPIMQKNAEALATANLGDGTNEGIIEFQYRMRHRNGDYRWFQTFGTVFDRNKKNQVEHVINISLDITENVKAEQILLQRTHELQQSNASLEEFAFVASHDLNEPLRKISTFTDLLLSLRGEWPEKEELYLQKILNSTSRMRQMIDDLLSLSLVSGTKAPEKVDLNSILSDVLLTFEHKIEQMNVVVKADQLPPAVIVSSQFRQLFQNLISNSLKFSRIGVKPEITVTHRFIKTQTLDPGLKPASKYLEIVYQDNGIGFENVFSDKIFAVFQRLHQKETYEGTGIGLAICKRVVTNHGGLIKASGIPNMGATFTIIIPQ